MSRAHRRGIPGLKTRLLHESFPPQSARTHRTASSDFIHWTGLNAVQRFLYVLVFIFFIFWGSRDRLHWFYRQLWSAHVNTASPTPPPPSSSRLIRQSPICRQLRNCMGVSGDELVSQLVSQLSINQKHVHVEQYVKPLASNGLSHRDPIPSAFDLYLHLKLSILRPWSYLEVGLFTPRKLNKLDFNFVATAYDNFERSYFAEKKRF